MEKRNTRVYDLSEPSEYKAGLKDAAAAICGGGLVVFPTETVYGLGANALDPAAVAGIFHAKGRPMDNPLIVHVSSFEQISEVAFFEREEAVAAAKAFLPGPLTLILPKKSSVPDEVCAGLPSVGVRMPSMDAARDFLAVCGVPVAAPSANLSGKPSPTAPSHVLHDMLGRVDVILLCGNCEIGVESTVVDFTSDRPRILRPGGVSAEALSRVVELDEQSLPARAELDRPRSPGMKYRHYKPMGRVIALEGNDESCLCWLKARLEKEEDKAAVLAFEPVLVGLKNDSLIKLSLGRREHPEEAARVLFAHFRTCDEAGAKVIYTMCTSRESLGDAYLNRLYKAADEVIRCEVEE